MKIAAPFSVALFLCGGLFVACGGSQPTPETAPASTPAPEPAASASSEPPAPAPAGSSASPAESASASVPAESTPQASAEPSWEDKTVDQKKELMKTVVLPHMRTVFQELDPKQFAKVTCVTCHGEGAKTGKFDMPNPKLPKLDPRDDFAKAMKAHPKATKFMMERVEPEMAKLLGVPLYDPKTNKGFGCFDCHTMAGK